MDLERAGLLESRRGQGSFVASTGMMLARSERVRQAQDHLAQALAQALAEAVRLQIEAPQLRRLFEEELRRNEEPTGEPSGSSGDCRGRTRPPAA